MGISSVNYNLMNSYGAYNQKLTQETKEKLIELNISFSPNITENEGKRLIAAQEAKNAKEENSLSSNNGQKNDLFKEAKNLAQKLGIEIKEGTNFNTLLILIEGKLEQLLKSNQNNINALKELKNLSMELANLQAKSSGSSGYDNTNQALMTSLEMMAEYNKNYLNK